MWRRPLGRIALGAILAALCCQTIRAHAGVRESDPVDGATLGESPSIIRLSFSERPEASLSVIRVLDTNGAAHQAGPPVYAPGDPLSLVVPLKPLDQGVYVVNWRIVSAVDGHATAGAYAFGVGVAPEATGLTATPNVDAFPVEVFARWMLIVGLVAIVGAAAASLARFGSVRDLPLGYAGSIVALLGAGLLAVAQQRNAAVPFDVLFATPLGRALVWRAAAILCAASSLVLARFGPLSIRRYFLAATFLAATTAIAVHVASGHAAAGGKWPALAVIATQTAHFVAAGIWFGGLAALLLGVRGTPSAEKTLAVRRFSAVAAISLIVVVATAAARTFGELSSWSDLILTTYGMTVLAKIALTLAIAVVAAFNRRRGVPAAPLNLRPLRWAGGGELLLAAGALAAAAALGALPPPAALAAPSGLDVRSSDFGTTVRVHLTASSDLPGPNRFIIEVVDYDSKAPARLRRASLQFTPLDDPGAASTSLLLTAAPDGSYSGSGPNLAFDGRWRITASIERDDDSVQVPMEVETRSMPQFVSTLRVPGQAPEYTIEVKGVGRLRFAPTPERPGTSELYITCFDGIFEDRPIETIVVTAGGGTEPVRQLSVRRLDRSRFVAGIDFVAGRNRITAIARTTDGARMRAAIDLDVPAR